MTHPNTRNPRPTPYILGQVPDFSRYREQAHQERSKAINAAVAAIWKRIRQAWSITEQDARFWQA